MPSASDRLAPRVDVTLRVFLQTVDGDVPCKTRDASYEGVFIVRRDPLPLRKLIRFRARLPGTDDELQMLGLVAHTVNATDAAERGGQPGMGIQLFSLGKQTRKRWRDFVDALYEKDPDALKAIEESLRPDIRIRIPSREVLERFRTVDLPRGVLFVRTPELAPEGSEVDCIISHPVQEEDFTLTAVVKKAVEGTIKERGLQVRLILPDDTSELEEFLGGPIPDAPRPPSQPLPAQDGSPPPPDLPTPGAETPAMDLQEESGISLDEDDLEFESTPIEESEAEVLAEEASEAEEDAEEEEVLDDDENATKESE